MCLVQASTGNAFGGGCLRSVADTFSVNECHPKGLGVTSWVLKLCEAVGSAKRLLRLYELGLKLILFALMYCSACVAQSYILTTACCRRGDQRSPRRLSLAVACQSPRLVTVTSSSADSVRVTPDSDVSFSGLCSCDAGQ